MLIYTVSGIAEHLKQLLDYDQNLGSIWVTGEVSNVFTSAPGHRYFTLKDEGGQLKVVLFSGYFGAEHVAGGAQVNLHGRVSFYPARGDVQLYADRVMPAGEGLLAAEFERLKLKLEGEGLFDAARKRSLPPFPRRIGVVTSAQGAVIHDIANVLRSRYPLGELVLRPALVQGAEASADIADAIRALGREAGIDVIIVARGGGSLEDLWAFNTEEVARAIYASSVPIVSGVGHEPDFTIADYVADLRAPTPTAAAAAAAPDIVALDQEVGALADRARRAVGAAITRAARQAESAVSQMLRRLPDAPTQRQALDDILERARTGFSAIVSDRRQQADVLVRAELAMGSIVKLRREQVASLEKALGALNPAAVLGRGFAALTTADGKAVANASDVRRGDVVRATLRDGQFEAQAL